MVKHTFAFKSYGSFTYRETFMKIKNFMPERKIMDIEKKLEINASNTALLIEDFLQIVQEIKGDNTISEEKKQDIEQQAKKLLLILNVDPR